MEKKLSTALIFFIVFSIFSMFAMQSGRSGIEYQHRRTIIVDNSGNPETLTDYQVFLNVTNDSDMQADFDDLRFTWYDETSGEEVNIDYWLDKYVDSEYALVWVEVPEIRGSGEEVLYMYYGDPDALSESNGHETFVFFDDFSTDTTSNYEISRNPKGEISWNPNGWLLLNASVLEDPGRSANVMVRHKTVQIDETEQWYWLETNSKAFGNGVLDWFGVMKEYVHEPPPYHPNYYSSHATVREEPSNLFRLGSVWGSFAEFSESEPLLTSPKDLWYRIGLGTSPNGTIVGTLYDQDYEEITTIVNQTTHHNNKWRVSLMGSKHHELAYPTNLCVYFDYVRVRKFTDPEPSYIILLPAAVDVDPDTLNLKSNGQWITAYIELPEEVSPTEIDVSSILLNGSIGVDPEAPMAIADHDVDTIPDLMVKFERAAVIALLGTYDYGEDDGKSVDVALVITGQASGTPFEGVDTIRVLLKS